MWMADGSPGFAQAPKRGAVAARKVRSSRDAGLGRQMLSGPVHGSGQAGRLLPADMGRPGGTWGWK